jgi:PAS domain S-box-containing protein
MKFVFKHLKTLSLNGIVLVRRKVVMDNLEMLKAELERYKLRNSELESRVEELTDFVENASIPLHWVDEKGIILWANQAELDALGFTYSEYVGQPINYFHADSDIIDDILTRLTNNETLNNYPARLKAKDGGMRHVLISSNVLRKDGKFVHTRCFTKDITEIKKEEQRKVAFVSMVSHELKTPLTSLTSYIQILMRRAKKDQNAFSIHALSRAELQAKKMLNMLTDFLDQSKYQQGDALLHLESFDIKLLIDDVAADVKLISDKEFHLNISSPETAVHADRDKIKQVLINLISNAIKYSDKGGRIEVAVENHQQKVRVSVIDHGIGINALDQQRLFERFYRVNSDKSYEVEGFGIGLYLVSEIMRYHNSAINVISDKGRGSTFYFDLDKSFIHSLQPEVI